MTAKARCASPAVAAIAGASLLIHLAILGRYGYFVDELYYLACGRHLDWGYVDQPPLIALAAWLVQHTLGESVWAIRLVPALASAALILLTASLARQLSGGRFAQALAGLAVLAAPGFLAGYHLFSMNAFEPLIWTGCAWLLARMASTGNPKLWLWFGALAGIGLENKYSMLIFGAGLLAGLLISPERRALRSKWLWAGGAIALAVFLPNLVWNLRHGFPFLELQANLRGSGRDVALGPAAFFLQEFFAMNPLSLPVWLGGLWFFLASAQGRKFRALGWAWFFSAVVILTLSPRVYYLFPAFPVLFAGGGALWETVLARPRLRPLRYAWPILLAAAGAVLSPLAIPVLNPESYLAYTKALGLEQPRVETHRLGPLPQLFADQFGWEEMAAEVARVYRTVPSEMRARTAIFAQNYGQAGAIDLFGPRYGLPHAISGHQTYFLWGHGGYSGESMIVMGGQMDDLERRFDSVVAAGHVGHPYAMPYEHFDIYYCRGLKSPLAAIWPEVKHWR
jgi:hypothetical protein